jgi:hypothetical protein
MCLLSQSLHCGHHRGLVSGDLESSNISSRDLTSVLRPHLLLCVRHRRRRRRRCCCCCCGHRGRGGGGGGGGAVGSDGRAPECLQHAAPGGYVWEGSVKESVWECGGGGALCILGPLPSSPSSSSSSSSSHYSGITHPPCHGNEQGARPLPLSLSNSLTHLPNESDVRCGKHSYNMEGRPSSRSSSDARCLSWRRGAMRGVEGSNLWEVRRATAGVRVKASPHSPSFLTSSYTHMPPSSHPGLGPLMQGTSRAVRLLTPSRPHSSGTVRNGRLSSASGASPAFHWRSGLVSRRRVWSEGRCGAAQTALRSWREGGKVWVKGYEDVWRRV